jgi:hypothetical protein
VLAEAPRPGHFERRWASAVAAPDVAALRGGSPPAQPRLGERLAAGAVLGDRATALAADAAEAREALKGNANKLLTMDLLLESLGR